VPREALILELRSHFCQFSRIKDAGCREKAAKFRRFSCKLTLARGWPARVQTMERTGSTMIVGFLIAVIWLNNDRPHAVWRIVARASMMGDWQS
jgi:hypothetical protein